MTQWAQTWMTTLFWIPEHDKKTGTTVIGDLWETTAR